VWLPPGWFWPPCPAAYVVQVDPDEDTRWDGPCSHLKLRDRGSIIFSTCQWIMSCDEPFEVDLNYTHVLEEWVSLCKAAKPSSSYSCIQLVSAASVLPQDRSVYRNNLLEISHLLSHKEWSVTLWKWNVHRLGLGIVSWTFADFTRVDHWPVFFFFFWQTTIFPFH